MSGQYLHCKRHRKVDGTYLHVVYEFSVQDAAPNSFICLKVISSSLFCVIKPKYSPLLAIVVCVLYQVCLSCGLDAYILQTGRREEDLLLANREGVFSLLGYVSLYLTGVSVGRYLFLNLR